MTLILIGTGINFDLTLSAIEELKKCDEIYLERYTNRIENEKINSLEKIINKKIRIIERKEVESNFLINLTKNTEGNVILLVSGDPLIATTHISLMLDAKKTKIETKIIHNSSIYTAAIGKAGLQMYKFGKTCSISTPRENYKPTSWFDIITQNLERDMHTLVLLDTEPEPMHAKDALDLIESIDQKNQNILKNKKILVLSRIGEKDEKITYGEIEKLKKMDSDKLGKPPFAIIIPGKLHDVEQDFLEFLNVA